MGTVGSETPARASRMERASMWNPAAQTLQERMKEKGAGGLSLKSKVAIEKSVLVVEIRKRRRVTEFSL